MKLSPLLASAALVLAISGAARAEPSSWLSGGGGIALQRNNGDATTIPPTVSGTESRPAMSLALGVGSSPRSRFVVGGLFRMTTFFSQGTDIALGPRLATGGFARGDFGLALDVSVAARLYKNGAYGRYPVQAMVLLGLPFGFQVGVGAQAFSLDGGPQAGGMMALVELDLLRLTVMRQGSSTRYWENPSPVGGPVRKAQSRGLLGSWW